MRKLPGMRDGTSGLEVQKLQESHERIINLSAMGMSQRDIAIEVGCSSDKIRYTVNGRLGSDKLEEIQEAAEIETIDIARNIHEVAEKAIRLMDEVVSGDCEEASIKERLDIAKQVLHMDGFAPVAKQVLDVNISNMEKLGLENIKNRAERLRLLRKPEEEKMIEGDFKLINSNSGDMPEGL